jgi:hypothetical protein
LEELRLQEVQGEDMLGALIYLGVLFLLLLDAWILHKIGFFKIFNRKQDWFFKE